MDELQSSLSEEFRGLRKMLRKQAEAIEALRRRLDEVGADAGRQAADGGESLMRLAQAFFHLDRALRGGQTPCSDRQREAIDLSWLQLEQVLAEADIHVIREAGVSFDPRLHQATAVRESGAGADAVLEVMEPGFLVGGAVRRPARVIVGAVADKERQEEYTEEHIR